jgi:hypothetical protein
VKKGEKNENVPADHADVKQVGNPHELSYPKNDENGNQLG